MKFYIIFFLGTFIFFYQSTCQSIAQSPKQGENRLMYILWMEGSIWNETQKKSLEVGAEVYSDDVLTCKSGNCRFIATDSSITKHYRVPQKSFYQGVTEVFYKILTPFLFQHRGDETPEQNIPRLGARGVYFESDEQETELFAYKMSDSTLFVLDKCLLRINKSNLYDYYIDQEKLSLSPEGYLVIDRFLLQKFISKPEHVSILQIRCISRKNQKLINTYYLPVRLINESRLKSFLKNIKNYTKQLKFSKESYQEELFLAFWFNYGHTDFNQLNAWLVKRKF